MCVGRVLQVMQACSEQRDRSFGSGVQPGFRENYTSRNGNCFAGYQPVCFPGGSINISHLLFL